MTRQIGLVEQISYTIQRGCPLPDDRIGILQEGIARENRDAGVTEYLPPGEFNVRPVSRRPIRS